jgi:phosphate transport system protein
MNLPPHVRHVLDDEFDQLRLQVELMGARVDQNLERMRAVLSSGDEALARLALDADDAIDAMHVSLLERCYDLLGRESLVAVDLRFVVSVVRILSELERVGDLALRVVKLAPQAPQLARAGDAWEVLLAMVDVSIEKYRTALRAWSAQDLDLATGLAGDVPVLTAFHQRLLASLPDAPGSVSTALAMFVIGQAADRIADHAVIIGARLRYLLTGEPAHLVAEVR